MNGFWKNLKESFLWIKYVYKMGDKDLLLMFLAFFLGNLISNIITDHLHGLSIRLILSASAFLVVWIATFIYLKTSFKYLGIATDILVGVFIGIFGDLVLYLIFYAGTWIYFLREGNITAEQLTVLTYVLPLILLVLFGKIAYDVFKHKKNINKQEGDEKNGNGDNVTK